MPKAQALPSTVDERLAKIRKASLATQNKSRDSSRCLVFLLRFHCPIIVGSHLGHRQRFYVLTKDCGAAHRSLSPARRLPLTTENQTQHETDSERGKDRLRRVLADVLLAVVLKTADTIECIIQYFFRASRYSSAIAPAAEPRSSAALRACVTPRFAFSFACGGTAGP